MTCSQGHTKFLNEQLGPMHRYLDQQVCWPWDKVFSQLFAQIDRSSAVQEHVRDHVGEYVTTHVMLVDGVPRNGGGGWGYGKPLHQLRYRPWYVCPRTGLLRRVKPANSKGKRQPTAESPLK